MADALEYIEALQAAEADEVTLDPPLADTNASVIPTQAKGTGGGLSMLIEQALGDESF